MDNHCCIVKVIFGIDKANHNSESRGALNYLFQRPQVLLDELWLKQEVLWWIAADGKLRKGNEVDT
jgi:hypothetical protein